MLGPKQMSLQPHARCPSKAPVPSRQKSESFEAAGAQHFFETAKAKPALLYASTPFLQACHSLPLQTGCLDSHPFPKHCESRWNPFVGAERALL